MCHSMQELPYVESFVIDDTVMVVGSIQDLILYSMWTTVVCKIVELDEWSPCSPSAKGIFMYWPAELGRYVLKSGWVTAYGMEWSSSQKGV